MLSHRSHLVVCVSEATQREVVDELGVAPDKTRVILNGIDIERYTRNELADRDHLFAELRVAPEQLLFLTVGRLDPQKGQDLLVDALNLLPTSVRDRITFAFVGEATHGSNVKHVHKYERDLRNSVARHGYQQRVKFVGRRDDIVDLLSVADAFVQPSRWEGGHSLALMEAMGCGLPVIATERDGRPEGFVDSTHGYVVPTADAAQLARAIEAVATIEPGERSAMGLRCAELASNQYDGARGAKEFVDAVETAIKENS